MVSFILIVLFTLMVLFILMVWFTFYLPWWVYLLWCFYLPWWFYLWIRTLVCFPPDGDTGRCRSVRPGFAPTMECSSGCSTPTTHHYFSTIITSVTIKDPSCIFPDFQKRFMKPWILAAWTYSPSQWRISEWIHQTGTKERYDKGT